MKNFTVKDMVSSDVLIEGNVFMMEPLSEHVNVNLCRYRIKNGNEDNMRQLMCSMVDLKDGVYFNSDSGKRIQRVEFNIMMT